MTLVVVGLDAADPRLIERWNLQNLLLNTHAEMETFAHTREMPLTSEVWPTIATGVHPKEGGFDGRRGSDWRGLMSIVDTVAKHLVPKSIRTNVGQRFRQAQRVEAHFGSGDGDHVFADGAVYNWPGITPAKNWARSEWWLEQYHKGKLTDLDFFRRQMAFTGEELGWATAMAGTWFPIVGTRCHILDHAGHAWADQPSKLRTTYERVNELVGFLRNSSDVTELVVCSDHGMQTSVCGDESPGSHSWHTLISTTIDDALPESVMGVRSFLERHRPEAIPVNDEWNQSQIDTPTEHLKELGYIE